MPLRKEKRAIQNTMYFSSNSSIKEVPKLNETSQRSFVNVFSKNTQTTRINNAGIQQIFFFYFLECDSFRGRRQKKLVLLQLWIIGERQNQTKPVSPKSKDSLRPPFTQSLLQVGWQQQSSTWGGKEKSHKCFLSHVNHKLSASPTGWWEEQLISLYPKKTRAWQQSSTYTPTCLTLELLQLHDLMAMHF